MLHPLFPMGDANWDTLGIIPAAGSPSIPKNLHWGLNPAMLSLFPRSGSMRGAHFRASHFPPPEHNQPKLILLFPANFPPPLPISQGLIQRCNRARSGPRVEGVKAFLSSRKTAILSKSVSHRLPQTPAMPHGFVLAAFGGDFGENQRDFGGGGLATDAWHSLEK